jgi:hypothetical protein
MSDNPLSILDTLKTLVIPKYTTTERNTLVAEVGTIIYNTTTNKLNFCKTKAAGAGSWEAVTSA